MKPSDTVTGLALAAAFLLAGGMLYAFVPELWGAEMLRLLIVGGIAMGAYRLLCPATKAGYLVLLGAWALLAVGFSLNLWWFTSANGGTVTEPVLLNYDASVIWMQFTALHDGIALPCGLEQIGYASFLDKLFFLTSPRIDNIMIFSTLSTLLAIVFSGAAAARAVCPDACRGRMCTMAMGLMTAMCYFLASGALIIKDAFECMTMAVAAWGAVTLGKASRFNAGAWIALALVVFASWATRPYQLVYIALLMALIAIPAWRENKWRVGLLTVLIALCGVLLLNKFDSGITTPVLPVTDDQEHFYIGDNASSRLAAFNTVTGNIYDLSLWQRLVKLPFFAAVQFFTPLPWAFARDTVFGPSQAWAHVSYPWYAVAGLFLFFLLFCLRRAPKMLVLMAVFYCVAFLATAYVTGGTVARYCLPWLPFLAPCAAWPVIAGEWRSRTFRIYAICYAAVVTIGLALIFTMLNIYSPGGWEAA